MIASKKPANPVKRPTSQKQSAQHEASQPTSVGNQHVSFTAMQRAYADPTQASPREMRALNHGFGNQAVNSLIQTKLTVGAVGDVYEQEANQIANQLVGNVSFNGESQVQHSPANLQASPDETIPSSGSFEVGNDVESGLASANGSGHALPNNLRQKFESHFGADLGHVRVHTDQRAADLSSRIQAMAFTRGSDIYLGQGRYNPGTRSGQWLLAHEVTHTLQQRGNSLQTLRLKQPGIQRWPWSKKKEEAPPKPKGTEKGDDGSTGQFKSNPIYEPKETEFTNPLYQPKSLMDEEAPKDGKPVISGPTNVQKGTLEEPSSSKVVLQPDETGGETTKNNVDQYRNILWDYVKDVQLKHGRIQQHAEILTQDHIDVQEGQGHFHELKERETQLQETLKQPAPKGSSFKEFVESRKNTQKMYDKCMESENTLLSALHETDFDAAERDAQERAIFAQNALISAENEKAAVEYCYDMVEEERTKVHKERDSLSRKDKKDPGKMKTLQTVEETSANRARELSQQAKMSRDVVLVKFAGTDSHITHVQKKLDRIPGIIRKTAGKIMGGVLSFLFSTVTLGIGDIQAKTNKKGYLGEGLEKKGNFKPTTVFHGMADKFRELRNNLKARPKGPSVLDVVSAVLRGINEIFLQPIINIAGKIALISGLLAMIPPVAPVMAPISAIAGMIALAAGLAKVGIDIVRLSIDGITALVNKDAKMQNILSGRFAQTSMESLSDVVSTTANAVAPGGKSALSGHGFLNPFDLGGVSGLIQHSGETGFVAKKIFGATGEAYTNLGSTALGLGLSAGGPLSDKPLKGGVSGGSTIYDLYNQPKGNKMSSSSNPTKTGTEPIEPRRPAWIGKERQKENELRKSVVEHKISQTATQTKTLKSKTDKVTSHLGEGESQSAKGTSKVATAEAQKLQGVTAEETEGARAQQDLFTEGHSTGQDLEGFIAHLLAELDQMDKNVKSAK